jgi:hypothetical protein
MDALAAHHPGDATQSNMSKVTAELNKQPQGRKGPWRVEPLLRTVKLLMRERLAEPALFEKAPRRPGRPDLVTRSRRCATGNPELTLRQMAAQRRVCGGNMGCGCACAVPARQARADSRARVMACGVARAGAVVSPQMGAARGQKGLIIDDAWEMCPFLSATTSVGQCLRPYGPGSSLRNGTGTVGRVLSRGTHWPLSRSKVALGSYNWALSLVVLEP